MAGVPIKLPRLVGETCLDKPRLFFTAGLLLLDGRYKTRIGVFSNFLGIIGTTGTVRRCRWRPEAFLQAGGSISAGMAKESEAQERLVSTDIEK